MSRSITIQTDVEVGLDEFDEDDLIEELRSRRLSKGEANDLMKIAMAAGASAIEDEIGRATYELAAGRRTEALVWLERALPRVWMGRLVR